HAHLHSFPTRRSSDLHKIRADLLGGGGTPICVAPRNPFRIEMEAHMRKSYLAVLVLTAALAGALLVPPATSAQNTGWPFYGGDPDRKSTRLNSSHEWI